MLRKRLSIAHVLGLLLLVLTAWLNGCGGGQALVTGQAGQSLGQPEAAADPSASFAIPIPQDAYVDPAVIEARRASYSEDFAIPGDEFIDRSVNSTVNAASHYLQLNPLIRRYSWGLYQFKDMLLADMPLQITVTLAGTPPSAFYIGIADYNKHRWVWTGVDTPVSVNTVGVPSGLWPVNSGGNVYVAVAAYDQRITKILDVTITVHIAAPPPRDLSASDGTYGNKVMLSWTDMAISYPEVAYDRLLIERSAASDGPWVQIAQVAPGVSTYDDIALPPDNNYPDNVPQYYRLKTVVAGNIGKPCTPTTGYRFLGTPGNCSATDGLYVDKVVVTWDPVNGADGYGIYCRNLSGGFPMMWTKILETDDGSVTTFEHTGTFPVHGECLPNQLYNYKITALYALDEGITASNEDTGYRNSIPNAMLQAAPGSGNPPLTVTLDASASSDSDGGSIIQYEWDWTGDGTYDSTTTEATAQHTYASQGLFNAKVRVTDDENTTATASKGVNILGWAHTWGASGNESLRAVTMDLSGNVYAAGYVTDDVTGYSDVLYIKYNPTGGILWHKTWGDNGANEQALALATDLSGNAYLAGWTDSYGEGQQDMLLLKYSDTGTLVWQKTWGDAGDEQATGIYTVGSGGIFLAGYSSSFGTDDDVALIQVSNAGTISTEKLWDGGGDDRALCVASDGTGIYLCGYTTSYSTGDKDVLLLSADSLCNFLWQKTWSGTGDEEARGIAINSGNVYLAGATDSFGAGLGDGLLLKYDNTGALQWQKTWGGTADDEFNGVILDSGANVFLAGDDASMQSGKVLATLTKLDATGTGVWCKAWGSGASSQAWGMAINFTGSVALGGLAPDAVNGLWSSSTPAFTDATGAAADVTGTATNATGTLSNQSGAEGDPTGTTDTGGGAADALLLKIGPGL
jgi:hypothetical protein